MSNEWLIVTIDLIFMSMLWPTVYNLWKSKDAEGHSLWTSIPTSIMLAALIPLFWPISVPIALAHVPGSSVWAVIAFQTWRYRRRVKVPHFEMEEYSW